MVSLGRFTFAGGRSAADVTLDDHRTLRLIGAAQFVGGAATLTALGALTDATALGQRQHVALVLIGLLAAALRWSLTTASVSAARLTTLAAIAYIAAIVLITEPGGSAAILMLWPLLTAGYLLGRRDLIIASVAIVGSLAVSLAANPSTSASWITHLVPTGAALLTAGVLLAKLRERLDRVIAELEQTAATDGLTGLANRRSWSSSFEREIERARRAGTPLTLVMYDIDRFKAINDCLGHAEGDRALVRFANLLATECRSFDVPGRLGGEEFGLLLVGSTHEGAQAFNARLRSRLELVTRHDEAPFTVSGGVAQLDVHAESAEALLLAADRALYRAKHEGRDRTIVAALPQGDPAEAAAPSAHDLDALAALSQSAEQLSESVTLKLEPQPQAATTLGFSTLNPAPVSASTKSIVDPST